jgi:hypothetical protein
MQRGSPFSTRSVESCWTSGLLAIALGSGCSGEGRVVEDFTDDGMPAGIIMIMCLPAAGAEGPSLKLKFSIRPVAAGLRTSPEGCPKYPTGTQWLGRRAGQHLLPVPLVCTLGELVGTRTASGQPQLTVH